MTKPRRKPDCAPGHPVGINDEPTPDKIEPAYFKVKPEKPPLSWRLGQRWVAELRRKVKLAIIKARRGVAQPG